MGKIAWGITGAGHMLRESADVIGRAGEADVFVSPAGIEVVSIYKVPLPSKPLSDRSASTVAVKGFFTGKYDLLVISPATSNSVAKFVCGISDSLITNLFAQAGKARVPIVVFPTDLEEVVESTGATKPVKVFPRPVDLENTARLKSFPGVTVVENIAELEGAIKRARGLT
ncbi:MAG: flavoprotein [Nitrospinota bacterium]|nr:flavoprotein [Nitrospinota bacterium]